MLTILSFVIDQIRTRGKKSKMIRIWTKCVSSQRPCMNIIFHFILYIMNTFLCLVWNCSNILLGQKTNDQVFNYYFFSFVVLFFHVNLCVLCIMFLFFVQIKIIFHWNKKMKHFIESSINLIRRSTLDSFFSGSFLWMLPFQSWHLFSIYFFVLRVIYLSIRY